MKHIILLLSVVFAFTSIGSAQLDKNSIQKKKRAIETGQKVEAKTPAVVKPDALPEGSVLDLNSAPKSELMRLPGVSGAAAAKIITGRPFSRIEELTSRKILTQAVYEKIKMMLVASQAARPVKTMDTPAGKKPD